MRAFNGENGEGKQLIITIPPPASSREEEDVVAHVCPCGTTIGSRTHLVGACEINKEERDVFEVAMRKLDVCWKNLVDYESSEKTIAILGDRWCPQTAKQDGDKISKQFLCNIWKKT